MSRLKFNWGGREAMEDVQAIWVKRPVETSIRILQWRSSFISFCGIWVLNARLIPPSLLGSPTAPCNGLYCWSDVHMFFIWGQAMKLVAEKARKQKLACVTLNRDSSVVNKILLRSFPLSTVTDKAPSGDSSIILDLIEMLTSRKEVSVDPQCRIIWVWDTLLF